MKKTIVYLFAFILTAMSAICQKSPVYISAGSAIGGYDPVAYFMMSKPVKGLPAYTMDWQGAKWLFASQDNLNTFKLAPEKYAPQYGGYCAYGLADGHKASTEPDAWTISSGKLYLNYNKDVQASWLKDKEGYIQKADKNWAEIKNKQ
jgi:YHS domain-containing protein